MSDKLDYISEFIVPYNFIYVHSPTTFKLYIDVFSIAHMDLNISEAFVPFTILYEEK